MLQIEEKITRVRNLMDDLELEAVAFITQANFAWVTGGADNHVGLGTEMGASAVVITHDRAFILCSNIEEARMRDEESGQLGLEVFSFPWWEAGFEDSITVFADTDEWAADVPFGERPSIEGFMYPLRAALSEEEVAHYKVLGKLTGLALKQTADSIEIGQTEHEVAGTLSKVLMAYGVFPTTILVAADERINRYRHPIPTDARLKQICMIVVGARWRGLICSATRMVHFGKVPPELMRKHIAVSTIEAVMRARTVPGETIGDIIAATIHAYETTGYPNEWKLHHQGGPTGYKPREFLASPGHVEVVVPYQAFAWNPSITGTKCEDTVLAMEPYPEVLTLTPDWPTVEVESPVGLVTRPDIMRK